MKKKKCLCLPRKMYLQLEGRTPKVECLLQRNLYVSLLAFVYKLLIILRSGYGVKVATKNCNVYANIKYCYATGSVAK